MSRLHRGCVGDSEGNLAAAGLPGARGFDGLLQPQAEHDPFPQRQDRDILLLLDDGQAEHVAVESGARDMVADV